MVSDMDRRTRARLGISSARIRQMIIDGVIEGAEKIGRDNLITEVEIERLENPNAKLAALRKT